jgi:hypothetical protein
MQVIALPEVLEYLKDLIQTLYDEEYFGFEEAAKKYVEELFHDITTTLHTRFKRPAPKYFDRYGKGMYYAVFVKSKNTQWYVFFTIYKEQNEVIYLVRYIGNNHVTAQLLNV